ncbi:hypothetical protein JW926_11470, partial [Candidatus Sumerlaeota bacterium]|nr:hypothetical protein [Candidatus Sumerlaeota bacterium]
MGAIKISYDYNNAMVGVIGDKNGVSEKELKGLDKRAQVIFKQFQEDRNSNPTGFFNIAYDEHLVQAINAIAHEIQRSFENFVIVGMGGAVHASRCLIESLTGLFHNILPAASRRNKPRIFYLDNPDPDDVKSLLDSLDLKYTAFNIVSKSGDAIETIAIFMYIYNVIQRRFSKGALSKHFIITTDLEKGTLQKAAVGDKLKTLPIPGLVKESFSIFTPVGLLPAAVGGINIGDLLSGAREMDKICSKSGLMTNPAYLNAAIHYIAGTKKGKNLSIISPFSNQLKAIGKWYCEAWAETMGTGSSGNSRARSSIQMPIPVAGPSSQYTFGRDFLEGPNDKIFTFIEVKKFHSECAVPHVFQNIESLDYLANKDLGDISHCDAAAMEYCLTQKERPNVKFTLGEINAPNIGALLYLLQIQTAFSAALY